MGYAIQKTTVYESAGPCATCGVEVFMPDNMLRRCREEGGGFFCPSGHSLSFNETEVKKLRAQIERKQKELEWEQQKSATLEKSRDAYKGKVTEIKNRVGNGVCPCCRRSFQNLQRHMAHKHPEFKEPEK